MQKQVAGRWLTKEGLLSKRLKKWSDGYTVEINEVPEWFYDDGKFVLHHKAEYTVVVRDCIFHAVASWHTTKQSRAWKIYRIL